MKMTIASRSHPYTVEHTDRLAEELQAIIADRQTALLVDARVLEIYWKSVLRGLPESAVFSIEASEKAKSYEELTPAFAWLLKMGFQRRGHLVVIGGGVVQDIGCFIASVLFRGVEWTLVPTTLLAQCDSCIGSKSSLNVAGYKNQLGTFYPPHRIFLDTGFLASLSETEILSGLGEAIKLHMIEGEEALERLRGQLSAGRPDEGTLRKIVWNSLLIKKAFIEEDELDRGRRNLLNYGHTFAHAYEAATHYAIPHGIAVTLGVVSADYFSEALGWLPEGTTANLLSWLRPYLGGFAPRLKTAQQGEIIDAMRRDKKNEGGEITFILTRGPGRMEKRPVAVAQARDLLADFIPSLS